MKNLSPEWLEILKLLTEANDEFCGFYRNGKIRIFINTNDIFYWATSDLDFVEELDLPLLRQSVEDCKAAGDVGWGDILFAARKRGMRPQTCVMKSMSEEVRKLFEACGPERELGLDNG